jgi:hypothetical protein
VTVPSTADRTGCHRRLADHPIIEGWLRDQQTRGERSGDHWQGSTCVEAVKGGRRADARHARTAVSADERGTMKLAPTGRA